MNRILTIIIFLFTTLAFSQKEASVWYFGQNAGLKFNDNGSVTPLSDGKLNTTEGCSSISDANGNLLLYTDGRTAWDRNHVEMPGGSFAKGTELFGDPSSTQSGIIVPKPNDPNIYYIFTTDEPHHENAAVYPNTFSGTYQDTGGTTPKDDDGRNNGFNYSIVDLSVTGYNGSTGNVTSRNNPLITYNTNPSGEEIKYKCSEKVTAIKTDNDEYWVVTHFINKFYAFKVTSSGVSTTPAISAVGSNVTLAGYRRNAIGYLKCSPDGTKLAIAHSQNDNVLGGSSLNTGIIELLDFDTNTGIVTNPRILISGGYGIYGIEFSPDSTKLYVPCATNSSSVDSDTNIVQFDLSSSNIVNSKKTVAHSISTIEALQLAPNNKIYCAEKSKNYLGVINNPNDLGTACNYVENAQSLAGRTVIFGLPPFITSFFNITFDAKNFCLGSATQFTLVNPQNTASVIWDFGDGTGSNAINPSHQYATAGNYTVTATATSLTGKVVSQPKNIVITAIPVANTVSNQSVCNANPQYDLTQFNNTLLGSQSNTAYKVAYFASLDDANIPQNTLPSKYNLPLGTTTFYARVSSQVNPDCFATTSFTVTSFPTPVANTPSSIYLCDDASNDGKAFFDLDSSETAKILGTQDSNQYQISYHASQNDADTNKNPLAFHYQNISNPQVIYARIRNSQNPNCYATTAFEIGVNKMPVANQPQDLFLCDDETNDGTESFNLTTQDPVIRGNQSTSDFNITYHLSQSDADSGQNAVNSSSFSNTTNPQTIFARIENKQASTCFASTTFQLTVKKRPIVDMKDIYSICEGKSIKVTAPSGYTSYKWSNGDTGIETTITTAGNYSLTVTNDFGPSYCNEATKNFTVYNSNAATITKIDVKDWTDDNNSITIHATGDGQYEYSIDGIKYQDSPIFTDLPGGAYTVYVNDKKGCGVTPAEVYLLTYPKFFTPNDDSYNDVWKIEFASTEPELKVLIFDRYGKLLKQLYTPTDVWDGTYNGHEMPSSDYWFVVTRADGTQHKGHFSLIR